MHHVMFDIDGTLVESYDFDSECFTSAVKEITGLELDTNWDSYKHVTDTGILNEFFKNNHIINTSIISEKIKSTFVSKIAARLTKISIQEIPGASLFIAQLKARDDVVISFATGGWYESAVLKLASAGIDFSNIVIASSNDHYSRVEIMKIAQKRAIGNTLLGFTYFGDGNWDLKACQELGVNFVLVGDKLTHNQSINNFIVQSDAFAYIGK